MPKTTILGIDPGLQITGYAVLETGIRGPRVCEAGIIRAYSGSRPPEMAIRLKILYDGIVGVIRQYKPDVMAMEQIYAHYRHPRTAILMAHARGVLMLAGASSDLEVFNYNATLIKKMITGNGRAPKEQVQRTIQSELSLDSLPEPPDVADALAIALCHYHSCRKAL